MQTILKHIKNKPMSIHQMAEMLEVKYATARQYLNELKKVNNIYIAKYERTKGDFRPHFKFGNKDDVAKPKRIPHWVYDMKRSPRPSRKRKDYETNAKPRRDVAAAWF